MVCILYYFVVVISLCMQYCLSLPQISLKTIVVCLILFVNYTVNNTFIVINYETQLIQIYKILFFLNVGVSDSINF